MPSAGVTFVDDYTAVIKKLLARAKEFKPDGQSEPALTAQEFEDGVEKVGGISQGPGNQSYASIETACRNIFYNLLVSALRSTT